MALGAWKFGIATLGRGNIFDLSVPFGWTQGMRRFVPTPPSRAMPWQEVLWRRLTGRFGGLRSGETTRDSEIILGIDRNVYYYLGSCHPDFGLFVATFGEHSPDAVPATAVSPFDTGGIAQGHIPLTTPILPKALVKRDSYKVGAYQANFNAWVSAAYPARDDYPTPQRPKFVVSPEIDLAAAEDDGRAWMWEGRVAARDLSAPPLKPTAVFFQPGRRIRYRDWIKEESSMTTAETSEHIQLIASIGRDDPDPARAARQFIIEVIN